MHGLRVGLPVRKTQGLQLHSGQAQRCGHLEDRRLGKTVGVCNGRQRPDPLLVLQQGLEAIILRLIHQT